jgi:moderate conductance mechanosensitive channel
MQIDAQTILQPSSWRTIIDWELWLNKSVQIVIIIGLAWGFYRLLKMFLLRLQRAASAADSSTISLHEQRIATLLGLARSVGMAVIALISLFMVLTTLGIAIGPLLAGAGVFGLAISFGAQSLVRDFISGLFILFENQFAVGDVIRIGDVSGKVETMTLRIVVMRDLHGTVHIVPNGEINRVSNLTRSFARAVVDVSISYREDADKVMEIMRDVGQGLWKDPTWRPILIDEPTVPGIESFTDTSVDMRILATTIPLKQWDVARELRRRLKRRFDEDGVETAFPHRTINLPPKSRVEG